jgi:SCP-2 sterol transfer family
MSVVHSVSNQAVLAAIPAGMARRFNPEAAGDLDATIEMRVGEGRYEVRVKDRRCTIERVAAPEAGAFVTISPGDVARLIAGTVQWPVLLAANRLELGGDPFLALRFPQLFGISTR